jgi:hypothetical protein
LAVELEAGIGDVVGVGVLTSFSSDRRQNMSSRSWSVRCAFLFPVLAGLAAVPAAGQNLDLKDLDFTGIKPCRLIDTRDGSGASISDDGPVGARSSPGPYDIAVRGFCGVPVNAKAVVLNLTVVAPTQPGDLRVAPTDAVPFPVVSTLNYPAGVGALGNAALVPLSEASGNEVRLVFFMGTAGSLHIVVDVNGYFAPGTGSRRAYFDADGTFTVPEGVSALEITAIGGGGAGGYSGSYAGGGGGGSGVVATVPVAVAPGEVLEVSVGWGGGQGGQPRDGGPTVVRSLGGTWRVEVAGGKAGQHAEAVNQLDGGAGGAGYFGGGGGSGSPAGAGGAGVIADGGPGDGNSSGAGASGGAGVLNNHLPAAGGGGGPGGGVVDVASANDLGGPGTQPGAGGSGGSSTVGEGHAGAVLIRWIGPPA